MAPPRWLDEPEQAAWRGYLRMHAELVRRLDRQLRRDSDLSASDYEVLVHLSEAPDERLRLFELGTAIQWEKSRLSHHLSRMERRALVRREECTTDGRGAHVVLAAAGRRALRAAAPGHVAELRAALFDALTPAQVDQLASIAAAVLAGLDPDGTAADGNS